MPDRKW